MRSAAPDPLADALPTGGLGLGLVTPELSYVAARDPLAEPPIGRLWMPLIYPCGALTPLVVFRPAICAVPPCPALTA